MQCPLVNLSALCLWLALAGCRTTAPFYDYTKEPDPRSREFVLGPGDLLRVTVWGDANLTQELRVRPDGIITMPLVGDVKAGGRTPSEVRRDIQGRVERFLKSEAANVTVGVVQANSYFFTITGNIDKPGRYTATEYVTLLEAMALGGEPNRFATPERMMIVRRDSNGGTRVIPIDYTTLKSGVRMEQNIVVLAGDLIIVP